MTGHRALEKKQITQGNNRKVQNPSESPKYEEEDNPQDSLPFCIYDLSSLFYIQTCFFQLFFGIYLKVAYLCSDYAY